MDLIPPSVSQFDIPSSTFEALRVLIPESSRSDSGDTALCARTAQQFLYYYEDFHAPFYRGDVYRAFNQYCLAFFKFASLVGISMQLLTIAHLLFLV